jgi:phosphoadenosine phosphosulfate reductase
MLFSAEEIERLSNEFETASPQEIIAWAVKHFCPALAASSSFQTQSVPLLHMISQIHPEMRIFFLDTGMHFWETLIFREQLERELSLNIVDLYPDSRWSVFLRQYGKTLPQEDPDLCCYIRKVQPMQKAMSEFGIRAWISGIRRDQTKTRARAKILEFKRDGLLKIAPMLNWTKADVMAYAEAHALPRHPLPLERYPSVGCKPCTRPVNPGESDRAGRWAGQGKTECGLHTEMFEKDSLTPDNFKLKLPPE